MKILVFTEGTIIMHSGAVGRSRVQVVKQSLEGKATSLRDWKSYIPIGEAVGKLKMWRKHGVQIVYLSSRTKSIKLEEIRGVLSKHSFPKGELLYRHESEEYKDVVQRAQPDLIVEDDGESIGGKNEMTFSHLEPEFKRRIKSVAVKEFGGIDHLPNNFDALR